jgi:quercetin dioxygenase-like cupin family protein
MIRQPIVIGTRRARSTIHRLRRLAALSAALAFVIGILAGPAPIGACASMAGTPTDVTVAALGAGPLTESPGRDLVLLRVTLAPGALVPAHSHSGDAVLTVESGILSYEALLGKAQATWGSAEEATDGAGIAHGAEVLLYAGDWLREPNGTIQRLRNAGPDPVVLLVSAVIAADEPFFQSFVRQTDHQPTP